MKTLHTGSDEFSYVRTDTIGYDWKFEDAEDHEHPFILTVTVAGETHSEGFEHAISDAEAAAKAQQLAEEVYAAMQTRS